MNISLSNSTKGSLRIPPLNSGRLSFNNINSKAPPLQSKTATPNIELAEIQRFLSLSLTGSYTETAYRLGISETHIRRQIRNMEKQLGFKALEKNDRGKMVLTKNGKAWLSSFRPLQNSLTAYTQKIHSIKRQNNLLSIAVDPSFALSRFLRAFIEKSQVLGISDQLDIQHHRLEGCCPNGEFDAYLSFAPSSNSNYSSRIISTRKLWAYSSDDYKRSDPNADPTSVLVPPPLLSHCCGSDPSWCGGNPLVHKTCIPAPCTSESLILLNKGTYILVSLGIEDELIPENVHRAETEDQTEINIYLVTKSSALNPHKSHILDALCDQPIQ